MRVDAGRSAAARTARSHRRDRWQAGAQGQRGQGALPAHFAAACRLVARLPTRRWIHRHRRESARQVRPNGRQQGAGTGARRQGHVAARAPRRAHRLRQTDAAAHADHQPGAHLQPGRSAALSHRLQEGRGVPELRPRPTSLMPASSPSRASASSVSACCRA